MTDAQQKNSRSEEKTSASHDPFQTFRTMRDACLDAMAKAMVEAVNTEGYAQATGNMLEGYLSAVAPFREALDKSMLLALQHLELPSRQEVAALAERFTNVEMRLDDIDAKLDSIARQVRQAVPTPQPPRAERAGTTAAAGPKNQRSGTGPAANRPPSRRPAVRRRVTHKPR